MQKTVFLFGAGASAKAMPINKDLADRIKNLAQNLRQQFSPLSSDHPSYHPELEDLLNYLIGDLEWVAKKSNGYKTVDTWAEELKSLDNINDLNRLKLALVTFFELEPRTGYLNNKPDLDPRYLSFYEAVWPGLTLAIDKPIKVLSWNYDTQLELGRARYIHQMRGEDNDYCLESNLYALKVVSKNSEMYHDEANPEHLSCYRLNGIACLTNSRNKMLYAIDNNGLGKELTKNNIHIFLLSYKKARNISEEQMPAISYAWETDSNSKNNIIKLAQEAVKNAEVLVVIGYSFPDGENKKVDAEILSSMKSLKKVYIQDLYPVSVVKNLQNIYKGPAKIIKVPMNKDDDFYIPHELPQ